ncbi:MAG: serine/threonine-protein kinase [Kofleriaceae bacterium]
MEGSHPGDNPTTMDSIVRAVAKVETQPIPLASGQVLDGTYELVERIGGGGMGVVFRARDRHLGRDVAVKVLKLSAGEQGEHRRMMFEREARATAQLLHPNIVTLHHVGEQAGHPYLVLELLAGETLATRLGRKGKLPVLEALAILDAILAALTFAHEHGVLHRDLKPNNVFVTVDDRVKVLDFGVALSLDTHPGPATRSAGTPGYMVPNRPRVAIRTFAPTCGRRAALLECLLGRRPDDRDAVAAAGKVEAPGPIRVELERALASIPRSAPRRRASCVTTSHALPAGCGSRSRRGAGSDR